jgi:TRAP-type mannitol/chloroaromatic compound transport system permease large subunit
VKRGVWFGFTIMALIVVSTFALLPPPSQLTNGHLGLLMLSLIVVAIMLGFPTAFTLMGMGMIFTWLFYNQHSPDIAMRQTLDLMVQRAYGVMANDVLISIPLFVFMGYLVERANLIEKLFKSLHLAMARVPGSLAVATIVTCAIFATATGIVGAVVTLMGLLAFPAMLRAGYNVQLSAGAVTAGGCLGILIPPSVLLIVYGATAGVSVVQLYAGAFFPGIMLAMLYVGYVIVLAKLRPDLAPPLSADDRRVELPPFSAKVAAAFGANAAGGLLRALKGRRNADVPMRTLLGHLVLAVLPALGVVFVMAMTWHLATAPTIVASTEGLVEMSGDVSAPQGETRDIGGVQAPVAEGVQEPPAEGVREPPMEGVKEPPSDGVREPPGSVAAPPAMAAVPVVPEAPAAAAERLPTPLWCWIFLAVCALLLAGFYAIFTLTRLEIFKMLLTSFFPLAMLILAVLGTIVFGLATPTEAAAVGSFGGFLLAAAYRYADNWRAGGGAWRPALRGTTADLGPIIRESTFLTAKTSAMVCWLFVGSSIFSAAFALLGGQEVIEQWVLSLNMTPVQFMVLAQVIIFLLGWPLEWTEIIVIFMPIFIPLLPHFNIDPLFFGLLVALNLQTAFLSPPVAMAAFYLKGVSPPHVTLNQIFVGMMPFMVIQVIAVVLLYLFPGIGLWLPNVLYK